MPSSIGTRHALNASEALLLSARASIDAALVAIDQARGFILPAPQPQPEPPSAEPEPTAVSKPRAVAKAPRAPRAKRASVGGAGSAAAPPFDSPAAAIERVRAAANGPPASSGGLDQSGPGTLSGAFTLTQVLAAFPQHTGLIDYFVAFGRDGALGRVAAEKLTGSKRVAAHGPVYSALAQLVKAMVLEQDGRRFRLGAGLA